MTRTFRFRSLRFFLPVAALVFVAAGPAEAAGRQAVVLNDNWRFIKGDPAGAAGVEFDDSKWAPLNLPHTWNALDGQDGKGDYYRGPGWYRRKLEVPAEWSQRRLFLRFGAANTVAQVFVNGREVGRHRGGYAAFAFEVTKAVRRGASNTIAVRVDNSHFDDVPPWSADFTFFGGIYRDVTLIVTDPVCISPLDYASPGVYLRATDIDTARAVVEVKTVVSNGATAAHSVEAQVEVLDAGGKAVATEVHGQDVPPGVSTVVSRLVTIPKPRLWNGLAGPYLYSVGVRLAVDGRVVDEVVQPLGLRSFRVDPKQGFVLNGRAVDLHGVNCHQDRIDRGWAVGPAERREDLDLVREMGCTAVRLAHYQHADYVYSRCDELGLVVWAEIPLVNRINETPAFRDNCRQQLIELIRQNYNHPSICFWGIHNEITASWAPGPDPAKLIGELNELAHQEDDSRLTVCAATDPVEHPANWKTDLTAFNRYFGWYWGEASAFGAWADKLHAERPDRPVGVSEYGAGASIEHHQLEPVKPRHDGLFHPEEWQARLHEEHWRAMKGRPFLWCKLVWNMFDFASDARAEGDAPGRNDKGLVTYDRKTRKDAFYWYKANWSDYKARWSDEPFVHITSARADRHVQSPVAVKVYSNCPEVELFVGDRSCGQKRTADRIFTWTDVALTPGANEIRAVGSYENGQCEDRCRWHYHPTGMAGLGFDDGEALGVLDDEVGFEALPFGVKVEAGGFAAGQGQQVEDGGPAGEGLAARP